jgi:photosystem II stability/assembly factor-like uncharacterized protein
MTATHRLYVGTVGEGLWRSKDGGESFVRACDGMFVECHVRALAVHPRDDRTLILGCELGLFRSNDGADNWSQIDSPLNGQQIWSILIVPHNPDVILVGTCPSRLFRSDDGGHTWGEATATLLKHCPRILNTRVTTLLADPEEKQTLWAGVEIDGIRRSRDLGRTWECIGEGLSSQDIHALAVVPGNGRPRRMLAATNNDLNLCTDGGETWTPQRVGQSMPWSYCRTLAQLVGKPEVVFLGNGDGPPGTVGVIGVSTDGGATWRPAAMPDRANSTVWNFATHPANPDLVYASSVSGEVYRSADGGGHWAKLPREFGEIRALAWTP